MNEVEELTKLDSEKLPALKSILFDDLHHKVLNNLYLEMGTGPVLYLLSPSYSVVNPTPNETISDFLNNKENLLDYIKEYIMQNLAVYSVLLDVNSYFVEANNYLLLARLRERDSGGRRYEIKFYTHSALELMTHYADKIYIGRDFIDLFHFKRKYMGVKDLIISVKEQYEVLLVKAEDKESVEKELNEKKETFDIRIKALDRQEKHLMEKYQALQQELSQAIQARRQAPGGS